ncbi:MAG: alpha/beta hydrolase-fold protein, partial [Gammaproteobacteria bacterium]|nr:alpha/beta hydrolase-fold protein [Gammaproteobacteria bacterium]
SLRDTHYEKVESEKLGRPFHVYTMLPESYDEDSDQLYPTIYVLDGGALFPLLAGYYRYLRLSDEIREAIIVGISYGSVDFEHGNYRSTDYTAPSDEREWWGGAAAFQRFLQDELMPAIEKQYRSDAGRRIIFGQSQGGQFVLFSAQTKPDMFWGHIASNPAMHRNLDYFLSQRPPTNSSSLLFVSSGTLDEEVFRTPFLAWAQHWRAAASKPWKLNVMDLEGHTHFSAAPASFRQGLSWLYAVESAD